MPIPFRIVAVWFALLFVLSPHGVWANEPEPPSDDASTTYTTTVRGRAAPASASEHVIDGELVQATAKADAGEALQLVPGLVVSRHGGAGKAHQMFLRGFDAIHGQDVELSVGGTPVNEVSHVHALGYADIGFVVPEVISEITAFEGPYRADQGDFAVAGTVRLSLAAPGTGAFGTASLGQYGNRRLMAGLGAEDRRTFAVFELAQGEGEGPARSFTRSTLLAQGHRRLGDLEVRTLAGAYAVRFGSPGVLVSRDYETGAVGFFETYDPNQGGSSQRLHLLIEAATPDDRSAAAMYLVRQTLRLKQNFTGFWFDPRGDGLEQVNDTTTVGLTLRTADRTRLLGLPLRTQLGAGVRHDLIDQSQRGYQHADGAPIDDSSRAEALALAQTNFYAFVRALASPGRWNLTLGLRTDALAARTEPQLSKSGSERRNALGARAGIEASIARKLGRHAQLILQYGDGFRSPHAASLADGERTPFVSVRGGELGLRWDTRALSWSLAGFTSWVGNDIFFDHTTSTSIPVGKTIRAGATASASATPGAGLRFLASGTVAHAVALETGTLLPGFIPYVGRLDATWNRALELNGLKLFVETGASVNAIGPRPMRFGDVASGHVLADLRLTVGWKRIAVRIDVSNLLDTRWTDGEFTYPSRFHDDPNASSLPTRHFTAGAARTATLSLVLLPGSSSP